MALRQTCTTIDYVTGKMRADASDPVQPENFSDDDSPKLRTKQLSRLQVTVTESTNAARAQRRNGGITFENIPITVSGQLLTFGHSLGRFARWCVVDWVPIVSGNGWVVTRDKTDAQDAKTLRIRAYTNLGTLSIEVF